jgi:hypothetical protein
MWRGLKRWQAWAKRKLLWPLDGLGEPRAQVLEFGYQKASLTVRGEPVPWNAESVLLEAVVEGRPDQPWSRSDFHVRAPGDVPCMAIALEPLPDEGMFRVLFRLPPLQRTTVVKCYWRACRLGQVAVPYVSREEFVRRLSLEAPTVFARLGQEHVACRAVVRDQCCQLMADGLLKSPTSLVPLTDLGLALEVIEQSTGRSERVSVRLAGAQALGRQALLSVLPPWRPWEVGSWSVQWTAADRVLARQDVRVISQRAFEESLYLADGCFFYEERTAAGSPSQASLQELMSHARPCFLVASREPGVAGLCSLELGVQFKDGARLPGLEERELIVTDLPSAFVPAAPALADCQHIHAFQVFSDGRLLGSVCSYPTPVAHFTSEGGFVAAEDYSWTPVAEAELEEHLGRLMEVRAD